MGDRLQPEHTVHLELDLGRLVSKRSEHVFLVAYEPSLVFLYPQIDIWHDF